MERIKWKKLAYGFFFITGMVLGFLGGAALLSMLLSYRIDQYHQKISYLETIITEQFVRLDMLEESVNNHKFIVKKIQITLSGVEDEIEKIELEKHIKEKYGKIIGKEVRSIDIELIADLIDKRIMLIGDKEYKIKVTKVMLSELLVISVDVEIMSFQ